MSFRKFVYIVCTKSSTFILNCVSETTLCTTKVVDIQSVLKKIYYVIPSWYLKVFADFLVPWSFIAIAADTNSIDTVGFIQIVESSCVGDSVMWYLQP